MELTYDSYLEHYGVKGMKWGVRKKRNRSDTPKKPRSKMSPEKKKKILKGVAAGVAIGGTVAVAYATRNTPASRKARMMLAATPAIAKTKISEIADERSYQKAVKRAQRFKKNDQFVGKNKYEVFNMMNQDTTPKDVRRVMNRVDRGTPVKDAIAKEAIRYGGRLAVRYAKKKVLG